MIIDMSLASIDAKEHLTKQHPFMIKIHTKQKYTEEWKQKWNGNREKLPQPAKE